jgi:hypothetical protein
VVYLRFFPYLNVVKADAGITLNRVYLFFVAWFLLWATKPGRRFFRKARRRKSKAPPSAMKQSIQPGQLGQMTPEQTTQWIKTYKKHTTIYIVGFFMLVLGIVLFAIYREMGALTRDVWGSFIFFFLVFLILVIRDRRITMSGWRGQIIKKTIRTHRRRDNHGSMQEVASFILHIDTGFRKRKIRVNPPLFEYFNTGDEVFKVSGFNFPEKVIPPPGMRCCIACGAVITDPAGSHCTRCKAPIPHHQALLEWVGYWRR